MTTSQKHFVSFLSPGTFVSEESTVEVTSWNVDSAITKAREVIARHGAKPYGFRFKTVELVDNGWKQRTVKESGIYYLGGRIRTVQEVKAAAKKDEEILLWNMENNGYDMVIENTNSYKVTMPFRKDDTLLNIKL